MRGLRRLLVTGLATLCLGLVACSSGRAVNDLKGHILFYEWTHGAKLSERPQEVARITRQRIRSLREIEDFTGTLEEWGVRTGPVEKVALGPEDYALGQNLYFYFLASLRVPAVTEKLRLEVTRTGPDGIETTDLITQSEAQMNRHAQSGGMLYSMAGLEPGEHLLHLEVRDGGDVTARGDLLVAFRPGPENEHEAGTP